MSALDAGSTQIPVDRSVGKPLWRFPTDTGLRASPIAYSFDGNQHFAIASGANIISFALLD